jgi:hypothetical protein
MTTVALKRIGDKRERTAMTEVIARMQCALEAELPELGRGAAFFACRSMGLWRQIAVSVPVPDSVHWLAQPYIRPLVRTRDEHDRFVLALLSQERSRFFISQIGQVEEVFQVRGRSLSRALADYMERTSRENLIADRLNIAAHSLARAAELVMAQFKARYLLISAPPELRAAFLHKLSKEAQQRVGGSFQVDVHAGPARVAAAAAPVQQAIEEREELSTLLRIIEVGPQRSAWGNAPTLEALRDRRVMTLAVDDKHCRPGGRCRSCGGMWAGDPRDCPSCGSRAVEAVEDVVEMALEEALEQSAALELVRSDAARRIMTGRGPMAALLRW